MIVVVALAFPHLHVSVLEVLERHLVRVGRTRSSVRKAHARGSGLLLLPAVNAATPNDETGDDEHEPKATNENVGPTAEDHLLVPT